MGELETARLVGEILAILGGVGGGFVWLARLLGKVIGKIDHLQTTTTDVAAKQEAMNGKLVEHIDKDDERFSDIYSRLDVMTGRFDERDRHAKDT